MLKAQPQPTLPRLRLSEKTKKEKQKEPTSLYIIDYKFQCRAEADDHQLTAPDLLDRELPAKVAGHARLILVSYGVINRSLPTSPPRLNLTRQSI